jgi:hypothetical protein
MGDGRWEMGGRLGGREWVCPRWGFVRGEGTGRAGEAKGTVGGTGGGGGGKNERASGESGEAGSRGSLVEDPSGGSTVQGDG